MQAENVWGQQVVKVQAGCAGTDEKRFLVMGEKTVEQAKKIVSEIGTTEKIERVEFNEVEELSKQCLDIFAAKIQKFDNIDMLSFSNNSCDVTEIFKSIPKSAWQSLKSLHIQDNANMSDEEIQSLVTSITSQELTNLKTFNILNSNLNRSQVNDIITCLMESPRLTNLFLMNYLRMILLHCKE